MYNFIPRNQEWGRSKKGTHILCEAESDKSAPFIKYGVITWQLVHMYRKKLPVSIACMLNLLAHFLTHLYVASSSPLLVQKDILLGQKSHYLELCWLAACCKHTDEHIFIPIKV